MAADSSKWRSAGRSATNAKNGNDREHGSFRLDAKRIGVIEDVTKGIEEGEAGLKSCSEAATQAAHLGERASEVAARHDREIQVIEDEDECFNLIGDLLYSGFSFAEVAKRVRLSGGATKLLALERWCARVGLTCDADVSPAQWRGSSTHEERKRARRAFTCLRQTPEGTHHAAVLYTVYGHPDPTLAWAERHRRDTDEAAPGKAPKLSRADRETYTLARTLLEKVGRELAPLARYTDAVEAKRQELVREETARRSTVESRTAARDRHAHGSLTAALAHMAETHDAARLAVTHGLDLTREGTRDEAVAKVYDLERARGALLHADRCISSGDALRAGTAPFEEDVPVQGQGETRFEWQRRCEERSERRRAHDDRIRAFLTAIKLDANRMLTDASVAFDAAWRSSWRS